MPKFLVAAASLLLVAGAACAGPELGILCVDATPRGAKVMKVNAPSYAKTIGLEVGDVIVMLNNKVVGKADAFARDLAASDSVSLVWRRGTKYFRGGLLLAVATGGGGAARTVYQPFLGAIDRPTQLGLSVADQKWVGVKVAGVEAGGLADELGVRAGDVVVRANRTVTDGADALTTLENAGAQFTSVVWRRGDDYFIASAHYLPTRRGSKAAPRLVQPGRPVREVLGLDLEATPDGQARVVSVRPESWADDLGLRAGDTVLRANKDWVDGRAATWLVLADSLPDPEIVWRRGARCFSARGHLSYETVGGKLQERHAVLSSRMFTAEFGARVAAGGDGAAEISAVSPDGLGRRLRLLPGDVVTAVNGTPVKTARELVRALAVFEEGTVEWRRGKYEKTLKGEVKKAPQYSGSPPLPVEDVAVYSHAPPHDRDQDYFGDPSLLEETLKATKAHLGPDHVDTLTTMHNLAGAYVWAKKPDLAASLYAETLAARKRILGPGHPNTLATAYHFARARVEAGKVDLARPLFEEALRLGPDHPDAGYTTAVIVNAYKSAGKPDLAVEVCEKALTAVKARLGPEATETLNATHLLARTYASAGKLDRARATFGEALGRNPGHDQVWATLPVIAAAYKSGGKGDNVPDLYAEALRAMRAALGAEHPRTLFLSQDLAEAYLSADRPKLAIPLLEEAIRIKKGKPDFTSYEVVTLVNILMSAYEQAGMYAKAEPLRREAVESGRKGFGNETRSPAPELALYGMNLLCQKKWAEAEPPLRECLEARDKAQPKHWTTFNTYSMLGGSLLGQKKYADAEPLLLKGYEGMKERAREVPPQGRPRLTEAVDRLIDLYQSLGKPDEVQRWKKERALYVDPAPAPRLVQ